MSAASVVAPPFRVPTLQMLDGGLKHEDKFAKVRREAGQFRRVHCCLVTLGPARDVGAQRANTFVTVAQGVDKNLVLVLPRFMARASAPPTLGLCHERPRLADPARARLRVALRLGTSSSVARGGPDRLYLSVEGAGAGRLLSSH